jgi:hypothetical protein
MHKTYSLDPNKTQTTTPQSSSSSPQVPELYFNPRTNRWISKSCRVYRELMRDKSLIERGLPPGPKLTQTKRPVVEQKKYAVVTTQEQPVVSQEQQQELTELERRDALFRRYGL